MKKIITIILIISLLFSFGCVKKDTDDGKPSGKAFAFTGKTGITIEFEKSAPPSTTTVKKEVPVELKVTNRGAVSLAAGEIKARLKGVAATETLSNSGAETSNRDELLKAELDPTVTIIDLGKISYKPDEGMIQATYEPKIEAEICFPYETQVNINEFWISDKEDDLKRGKVSSSDNSDAPVHVSELRELVGGDEVIFKFIVENVGKGEVVEECFPEKESKAIVDIEITNPSGIDCETFDRGSSGSVELVNKRKQITCSASGLQEEGYKNILTMRLNYNYDLEKSKTITIENI